MKRGGGDGGFSVLEAVLLFAALVAILLLISLAARLSASQNEVLAAARAGARAGSQADDRVSARDRATVVAMDSLAEGSLRCSGIPGINVNTDGWTSGGVVVVTVSCNVGLDDLGLLGLGGVKTLTASSAAAIDTYREVTP